MTAAVANNRDRGEEVEDEACRRWPAERIDVEWHDVVFVDDVTTEIAPDPVVAAGTEGEAKSCFPDYRDRAGRWWIQRRNHDRLLEADGVYVLAVVERGTERVLRMALVDATTVDALVDGDWWNAGDGCRGVEEYRQLPWNSVFQSLRGRSP